MLFWEMHFACLYIDLDLIMLNKIFQNILAFCFTTDSIYRLSMLMYDMTELYGDNVSLFLNFGFGLGSMSEPVSELTCLKHQWQRRVTN